MFDHGPPPNRFARWTIGAIAAALMLLAACDPRRAIGDHHTMGSLAVSALWSLE